MSEQPEEPFVPAPRHDPILGYGAGGIMSAMLIARGLSAAELPLGIFAPIVAALFVAALTYLAPRLNPSQLFLPLALLPFLGLGIHLTGADPWFAAVGSIGIFASLALNGRTGAPLIAAGLYASVGVGVLFLNDAPKSQLIGVGLAAFCVGASAEIVARVRRSAWLLDRRQRRKLGHMGNLLHSADVLAALRYSDSAAATLMDLACELLDGDEAVAILPDSAGNWSVAESPGWPSLSNEQTRRALVGLARRMRVNAAPELFLPEDMEEILCETDIYGAVAIPLPGEFSLRGVVLVGWWGRTPILDELMSETATRFSRQAGRTLERIRHLQRIADDALRDPLTGVANRRALDAVLQQLKPGDSVAILDLDHFKEVNDTDGHAEGDRVLRSFAGFLRSETRTTDTVGRWGGEEFLVIFPGSLDQAMPLLERLRSDWEVTKPRTTFSAGLAMMAPGVRPDRVLEEADLALYQAKAAGRNRVLSDVDSTAPVLVDPLAYAAHELKKQQRDDLHSQPTETETEPSAEANRS